MTRLATVLTPGDLPIAELHAMRLDGELFAIDDAFAPIDLPETSLQRAASLAGYCHEKLIAEQRTAAWIWGAANSAPPRLELCASIGARARPTAPGRMVVREVSITDDELVVLAGVRVTSPLRTVVDLARFQQPFDADLVHRLTAACGLTVEQCVDEVHGRRNLPRKKLALARLAAV